MTIRSLLDGRGWAGPVLALAAGVLNVYAFAPYRLWPLQIATLALVFWLCFHSNSVTRSLLIGWLYGFGWYATGVYWLFISMHHYGGMPAWMAALAVALFATYLGFYAALALAGSTLLRQRCRLGPGASLLLAFPAFWLLAEWARGWLLTGFPWIASGYAHSDGPLAGYAPLVGVYGLALIAAWIAAAVVLLPARRWVVLPIAVLLAAGWAFKGVEWTTPHGEPVSVRLLQGDVPQELKFAPGQIQETLALYHDVIVAQPADLIATPETAIPLLAHQLPPDYLGRLSDFATRSGSHLLLGIPLSGERPRQYANSVLGMTPGREDNFYRYDKHHLVPFGEFIPFGFRWFVNMMHIPLGDFSRGVVLQPPFQVKDQWVLPNICYEDLFGEEIAAQLRASRAGTIPQATLLLNVSNIAWFGDSIALPQHLQISQMRALETGRPMLRATNTGVTAIIRPNGAVAAQLPPFQRQVLSAKVQGYRGYTPYTLYGNTLVVLAALLMLGAAWLLRRNKPRAA